MKKWIMLAFAFVGLLLESQLSSKLWVLFQLIITPIKKLHFHFRIVACAAAIIILSPLNGSAQIIKSDWGQPFAAEPLVDYVLFYKDSSYFLAVDHNDNVSGVIHVIFKNKLDSGNFEVLYFPDSSKQMVLNLHWKGGVLVKTDEGVTSFLFERSADDEVSLLVNGAVRRRAMAFEPDRIIRETSNEDILKDPAQWQWNHKEITEFKNVSNRTHPAQQPFGSEPLVDYKLEWVDTGYVIRFPTNKKARKTKEVVCIWQLAPGSVEDGTVIVTFDDYPGELPIRMPAMCDILTFIKSDSQVSSFYFHTLDDSVTSILLVNGKLSWKVDRRDPRKVMKVSNDKGEYANSFPWKFEPWR
jgi:hypothetical protein